MKLFNLMLLAVVCATPALADDPAHNWQLDGDLYLGTLIPFGTETETGLAMGGNARVKYESTGRNVLIYGELMGEGFNNGAESRDIKFSQFYLNSGLMLGAKRVKWKTPLNINVSRDIVSNEDIAVRFAFSGLYIKMLDETEGEGKLHQIMEVMADFVYEHVSYMNTNWSCNTPEQCQQRQFNNDRSILGLYAQIKYEIEKNGWGSTMAVDLVQDLSPSYTKATAKVVGFKQLSGELKNLRPYVEVSGVIDHDAMDPTNTLQGAVRIFGGISGRFGL